MNKFKQALKSWFIPGTENDHKPHILRNKAILAFAIVVLVLKLAVFGLFLYFPNSAYFSAITTDTLMNLINQSRQENGFSPLVTNDKLAQSAFLKAQNMLDQNYFAHTSPQGITPWYWLKQAGYDYRYAGENLAIDFVDAEGLHKALLDSPTHKANILNTKYEEIGIVIITGNFNGKKTTIAVQHFGTQFEKLATTIETPSQLIPPQPETSIPGTSPTFAELETNELASQRETKEEPILTPEEEKIETQIFTITQEKIKEFEKFAADTQTKKGPKILGTLIEKSDQITKEIYTYALLFISLALLLNIFVKFEVQHRGLVINCLLVIVLLIVLLLIGDKSLLSANLNIL